MSAILLPWILAVTCVHDLLLAIKFCLFFLRFGTASKFSFIFSWF